MLLQCWTGTRRAAVNVLVTGAAVLGAAGVADARVEVKGEPAQEPARDAALSFTAEAESETAGRADVAVDIAVPDARRRLLDVMHAGLRCVQRRRARRRT
jgi:hypothetical protein